MHNPSKPLRAALIGVGGHGKVHLEQLRALQARGLVQLCAVADPFLDTSLADIGAELAGAKVRLYADYQTLFLHERTLDFVAIVAPIHFHEEMVTAALASGARIYLEKPPVPTIQQWLRLVELDDQERVAVGFQMLSMEHLRTLRAWVESGALGKVQLISYGGLWPRASRYFSRADWAGRLMLGDQSVFDGPATNALAHIINNVMYLAGGVDGTQCSVPSLVEGEFYRARAELKSYDLASISGTFASGVSFAGTLGHCSAESVPYTLRVRGSQGSAWLTDDGCRLSSDCGLPESLDAKAEQKSVRAHYLETVEWAAGLRSRPVLSLRETEGYVRTTCGALLSAGTICPIPDAYVESIGQGGDEVRHVRGLAAAVSAGIIDGKTISQQGFAWAVKPMQPVAPLSISTIELDAFSSRPASATLRD